MSKLNPVTQAQTDWALVGEFRPDQFSGEEREQYMQEAERIEKQWDNQGE